MAEQHSVSFLITAKDQATQVLQGISSSFEKITSSYGRLSTLVGGTTIAVAMKAIVDATIEQERASNRLNAALKATGFSAGITRAEFNQIADDLKKNTPFDDEEILRGMSSMLRFRSVQGDTFREASKLAVDLAVALDTDLNSAFQRLGRALEDPEKGLRALREAGINVSSAQAQVKRVMEESGDVAKAQKIILDELQKSVGGAAAGENQGLYGSMKALGKALGDASKGWALWLNSMRSDEAEVRRRVETVSRWLALITPGGAQGPQGPSRAERDQAAAGAAAQEAAAGEARAEALFQALKKQQDEERAAREKRLREEDIKGWIAHADAIINEDFRIAEALAKVEQEEVTLREKRSEDEAERARRANQAIAERTFAIMEANMTELELLNSRLVQEAEILDAALENRAINEETHLQQMMLLNKRYQEDRTRLEDAEIKKRYGIAQVYRQLDLQSAGFFLDQLGAMMQSNSRTMFEVGKKAAIAKTIIDTYVGAQGAFAALSSIPIVGPVLGAIAAAAAIVAGLARVQQIRNTQFGAAGATPVFSANPTTGVPTSPILAEQTPPAIAQPAAPRTTVNVTIIGSDAKTIDYKTFTEEIVPLWNEAVANGAEVNLTLA